MRSSAVLAAPVRQSRLIESNWTKPDLELPVYTTHFPPLSGPTDIEAFRAEVIITGLETIAQDQARPNMLNQRINRVELLWQPRSGRDERRGAILFSDRGAQLHVLHALAGYGGNGPGLTEYLFKVLGASNIFDEINAAVQHRPYHVVASRQRVGIVDDIVTALPFSEPRDQWTWWELA